MSLSPSPATGAVSRAVSAPVLEVFASVQGEGMHVGEPQVFLRLAGCPLRCQWCDTPGSWALPANDAARARIGGARDEDGWATPFRVATWIAEVERGEPRTISVTGGEPLLWPAFLRELPTFTGERRLHLETAGAHPAELEDVHAAFDHLSVDLKLPADMNAPVALDAASDVPTSEAEWAHARRRVLALLHERAATFPDKDACVKIVVAGGRAPRAFEPLLDDVMRIAPDVPVYLQPATPIGRVDAPAPDVLLELAELALDRELLVRVVPQVHRALRLP